jgi:hypothetical protein
MMKRIITEDTLRNMEMLAVTNPGMKDLLEQCKVFYVLTGSPDFLTEMKSVVATLKTKMKSVVTTLKKTKHITSYSGHQIILNNECSIV